MCKDLLKVCWHNHISMTVHNNQMFHAVAAKSVRSVNCCLRSDRDWTWRWTCQVIAWTTATTPASSAWPRSGPNRWEAADAFSYLCVTGDTLPGSRWEVADTFSCLCDRWYFATIQSERVKYRWECVLHSWRTGSCQVAVMVRSFSLWPRSTINRWKTDDAFTDTLAEPA